MRATAAQNQGAEGRENDAALNAVRNATPSAVRARRVTMSATPDRVQGGGLPKRDSLRSLRAGAIWSALPDRDQHLLLWLLGADIVTAQLASILVYGPLRIAQRRLSRLVQFGVLLGFWTAGAQRPRGRYAYSLARAARIEIERLAWPEGRPDRPPELPSSVPVHQLATHDVFAAFLQAGSPALQEGLVVWVPERACGLLFGGLLRPDALAGIRVGDRMATLFIERDLGTERGEGLADKIRRYASLFARAPEAAVSVVFVVESERRGRSILEIARRRSTGGAHFLAGVDSLIRADPLDAGWWDGDSIRSVRELATAPAAQDLPILTPGCLSDAEAIGALDDRGAAMLPALRPYLRP
jgi:hypothetical protein